MDARQKHVLALRATDVQGAIRRLNGDEKLYLVCLKMFLDDPTMEQLVSALAAKSWDDAFTAAHALKGIAGNLGFVPLMHSVGQLVIIIRGGRTKEIDEYMARVHGSYRDITDAIRDVFLWTDTGGAKE